MAIIIIGVLASLGAAYALGERWPGRGMIAAVLLACVGAYAVLGAPKMADQPLSGRMEALREIDPRALDDSQRLAMLQDIARKQPEDPQPHFFIGQIMLQNGRVDEAIQAFQSALRRDSNHIPSIRGLADALVQADGGRVSPQTAQLYAQVLRAEPEDVQAAFMMGMGPWIEGHRDLARRIWLEAMRRMPEGSASRQELGQLVERIESAMANVGPAEDPDAETPGEDENASNE